MGQNITTGTSWSIAATYGTAATISAATNAAECVATLSASHGIIVGDIVHVTSGWARADNRLFRVKTVATNDVTLEGFNTTSTTLFPAGAGVGSVRKVATWAVISQVRTPSVSGGEQEYVDGSFLENPNNIDVPTSKSALKIDLELAHDISLTYRATIQSAQDGGVPVGMRKINPLGRPTYGAGFWSIQNMSTGGRNEIEVSTASISLANDVTNYAS